MEKVKTIKEIFEGKEDLLESKEIQEVLRQLQIQWQNVCKKRIQSRDSITKIEECIFNSEFFVIGGVPYKETIKNILDILE